MSRTFIRLVALLVVTTIALGAGSGTATAAENDKSLVPKAKLTQKPFRGITLITIGDRIVCTGFVVGIDKVATAAHCLVKNAAAEKYKLKPGLPRTLRVYRAYSQSLGGSSYRACGVSKVWAHAKFVQGGPGDKNVGSRAHDYAVLTTTCKFPRNSILRMWGTAPGDGQLTSGQKIRTAGYPADGRVDRANGLNMWRTEGRVRPASFDPRQLRFTGFIASGMSGGPVWRTFSEDSPCGRTHCVIGIVTECAINGNGQCKLGLGTDRLGVRITPQVKRLIKSK